MVVLDTGREIDFEEDNGEAGVGGTIDEVTQSITAVPSSTASNEVRASYSVSAVSLPVILIRFPVS